MKMPENDQDLDHVIIYTDGSCSGNPGPGGWAAVLTYKGHTLEISGGEDMTTNNRMELTAVISALSRLRRRCRVTLCTDSQYIEQAIDCGWLESWKKRGWKRKDGEVKNLDLWKQLDELLSKHEVSFSWVKGHAGNRLNNRCDRLAVAETEKHSIK